MNFFKTIAKFFDYSKKDESMQSLSDRMTNLIRKYNNNNVHYYKSFVVSLKSRGVLNYVNKLSTVDEKLNFYQEYNKVLVKVCEKLYGYFDPSCIYTFNNEIHLIYHYNNYGNYMFNGNINRLLTSISTFAAIEMSKNLKLSNIELNNMFYEGTFVQFNKKYEVLNYLIWRQHDCYRNTLSNVYTCYKNGSLEKEQREKNVLHNIKLNEIEDELKRFDIKDDVLYGMLVKKEIYYKENETDKNQMVTRKKYTIISKDLSLEFSKNLKCYIVHKTL